MIKDRIFTTALFISIAFHYALLFNLPFPQRVLFKIKPQDKLEVTYYKLKEYSKINLPAQLKTQTLPDNPDRVSLKTVPQGGLTGGQKITQQKTASIKNQIVSRPQEITKDDGVIKYAFNIHKPVVSDLKSDLKMKPGGAGYNYYKVVRERIRKAAVLNQPKNFQEGQVYIAFSLKKDGVLKDIQIVNPKTNASSTLKEAALKSVRDASPFPSFPTELKEEDFVNFSVIISFVLED